MSKDAPKTNLIKQGNREFLLVRDNPIPSLQVWYVYKVDGKFWDGKSFMYHKCDECGQIISWTLGGATRHYKMHEKQKTQIV